MGQQIGEACRSKVWHSIESAKKLVEATFEQLQLTWDGAINQARKYFPFAQERYPQYVDELAGLAEGANVEFDDLAVVNGLEAVTMDALHLTRCTSMAVNEEHTENGHVLVAHNEDWMPEDEADIFILHARPEDEPPFLAMTYGGLLPNIGLNALGIAQCCDSVYPNDSRVGIPRVVVSRAVLAARTLDQAIRSTLVPLRAAGYNHLIAHESGEIYNIEVSARHFSVIYAESGYSVHTNHYLDEKMHAIEAEPEQMISTRIRYNRASRMLRQKGMHSVASLQSIQQDHTNYPESICNHSIHVLNPLDREKTICSLVMDLNERQMTIGLGNPCQSDYYTFQLDA
jgi:isopenicillin-N N-acyltransferase-like protein